jgi:hypothetical protein
MTTIDMLFLMNEKRREPRGGGYCNEGEQNINDSEHADGMITERGLTTSLVVRKINDLINHLNLNYLAAYYSRVN